MPISWGQTEEYYLEGCRCSLAESVTSHVKAQHLAEKGSWILRFVRWVACASRVAHGSVKESIGTKLELPAIMIAVYMVYGFQYSFAGRIRFVGSGGVTDDLITSDNRICKRELYTEQKLVPKI